MTDLADESPHCVCGCPAKTRALIQEQITEASALFLSESLKSAKIQGVNLEEVLQTLEAREQMEVWSGIFDICYFIAGGSTAKGLSGLDFMPEIPRTRSS